MTATELQPTLLEDRQRVAEYDEALRAHPQEFLDHWHQTREDFKKQDIDLLDFSGWPLRPLFIPRTTLDFLCTALHSQLSAFRDVLLRHADNPAYLAERLALPQSFLESLDLADGLGSPDFLNLLRPDGFLFEDEYLLSEINFGNGAMVSCGYSQTLATLFRTSPLFRRLGWPAAERVAQPLQAFSIWSATASRIRRLLTAWRCSPIITSTRLYSAGRRG